MGRVAYITDHAISYKKLYGTILALYIISQSPIYDFAKRPFSRGGDFGVILAGLYHGFLYGPPYFG